MKFIVGTFNIFSFIKLETDNKQQLNIKIWESITRFKISSDITLHDCNIMRVWILQFNLRFLFTTAMCRRIRALYTHIDWCIAHWKKKRIEIVTEKRCQVLSDSGTAITSEKDRYQGGSGLFRKFLHTQFSHLTQQ